jgi:ribosomal protein S27E
MHFSLVEDSAREGIMVLVCGGMLASYTGGQGKTLNAVNTYGGDDKGEES